MKICVSTLGCPTWEWNDIISAIKDFGYDGVEIRGIANELFVPRAKAFAPDKIDACIKRLSDLNLEVSCLTSGCLLHKDDKDYVAEAKEYIDLASKLGCKYIRVLGDTNPEPCGEIDTDKVAERLGQIARYGKDKGVMPLVETNGKFASSDEILSLIEKSGEENVGILWDVHHPYRYMNEAPSYTYEKLKKYIKHVHVKDSIVEAGSIKYKMMGDGDMPIKECTALLKNGGFEGFVSLEWVKRWYEDLSEPGIVFMHFADYIKRI